MRFDRTCASSDGAPGLNLGEQIAGRSRLGTNNRARNERAGICRSFQLVLTKESFRGLIQLRLRDLCFHTCYDGSLAQSYKRAAFCRAHAPCATYKVRHGSLAR